MFRALLRNNFRVAILAIAMNKPMPEALKHRPLQQHLLCPQSSTFKPKRNTITLNTMFELFSQLQRTINKMEKRQRYLARNDSKDKSPSNAVQKSHVIWLCRFPPHVTSCVSSSEHVSTRSKNRSKTNRYRWIHPKHGYHKEFCYMVGL